LVSYWLQLQIGLNTKNAEEKQLFFRILSRLRFLQGTGCSNPAGPGLALLTAAPDNAGIASLRGKLYIYVICCHCLKISHE